MSVPQLRKLLGPGDWTVFPCHAHAYGRGSPGGGGWWSAEFHTDPGSTNGHSGGTWPALSQLTGATPATEPLWPLITPHPADGTFGCWGGGEGKWDLRSGYTHDPPDPLEDPFQANFHMDFNLGFFGVAVFQTGGGVKAHIDTDAAIQVQQGSLSSEWQAQSTALEAIDWTMEFVNIPMAYKVIVALKPNPIPSMAPDVTKGESWIKSPAATILRLNAAPLGDIAFGDYWEMALFSHVFAPRFCQEDDAPEWPYHEPFVAATPGDGKVMRFLKM